SFQEEVEHQVDDHDEDEQDQADAEQRLALQAAGVAHLLGDGGGQEGDALEQARHIGAVAGHHHHGMASPTARPMPSTMPAAMPLLAAGTLTLNQVSA